MTSKQSRTEFVDEHSQQQPPLEDLYYESGEEKMADEADKCKQNGK